MGSRATALMDTFAQGLRAQDMHSGLRNVDPNSPLLGPLNDTRVVGMAATLAGLIRGRDVIADAQAMMQVAAHQLDVNMLSFSEVINLLQDAGFVQGAVAACSSRAMAFGLPFVEALRTPLSSKSRPVATRTPSRRARRDSNDVDPADAASSADRSQ